MRCPLHGAKASLLSKNRGQSVTKSRSLPMEELRAYNLKVGAQAHEEVKDPSRIPVLCSGNTVGAGQAVSRRHLVTLTPKSSNLCEKLLD